MTRKVPIGIGSFGNDYMLSIATEGIPKISSVLKFGENQSVAADSEEDIWSGGGTYSFPSTADITHASQALDQAALRGGTIEVQGLNANFELTIQTVDLDATNTTTAVALTTPLIRVFRMRVLENVVADQQIHLHNVGNTTTYGIIDPGNNQTLMAVYTVPAGKTAYVICYYATTVESTGKEPKSVNIKFWTKDNVNNYARQIKHAQSIPQAGNGINHCFRPYFKIPEKTDIILSAYSEGQIAHVNAGFDIILIDDDL